MPLPHASPGDRSGVYRAVLVLVVALAIAVSVAPHAHAQPAHDPYRVTAVSVDVTAQSVAVARDRAFDQARRIGLVRLIGHVAGRDAFVDVTEVPAERMEAMVVGLRVDQEQTGPGRYIAVLDVVFDPAAVRSFLTERGVAFGEVVKRPVVVVPIWQSEFGPRLWDSPNPWHEAWLDALPVDGLVPMVVPFGDLQDIADIDVTLALRGDAGALSAIATRLDAGEVLIAIGRPVGEGVDVALTAFPVRAGVVGTARQVPLTGLLRDDPVAQAEALLGGVPAAVDPLAGAVARTATAVAAEWLGQTIVAPGEGGEVTALVRIEQRDDWFTVRNRLDHAALIDRVDVVSLRLEEAVVRFRHRGSTARLATALAQVQLGLEAGVPAPRLVRTDRAHGF